MYQLDGSDGSFIASRVPDLTLARVCPLPGLQSPTSLIILPILLALLGHPPDNTFGPVAMTSFELRSIANIATGIAFYACQNVGLLGRRACTKLC